LNAAYKNIFKAVALFSSVQGLNILLNLIRTKLVALFLGPAGVGLSSIYNETKELIHESTNMGMDQSGVREVSVAYEHWKQTGERERMDDSIMLVRSWVVIFALFGAAVCALFSYPLSSMTFGNTEHWWGYVLLSPAVGLATITCGEMAILKATRQLKVIASPSSISIIIGICTSIPLYYLYGMKGIIPALLLFGWCQMLTVLAFSYRKVPLRLKLNRVFLSIGKPMLLLGGALVLQGMIQHGTKLGIRSFINTHGSLEHVGLFVATTTIISTYLGIFASSLHTDFYPRLSGIFCDKTKRALTVTSQIDVIQIFTAPLIATFILGIHIIIPLLLSNEFNALIPILSIALVSCLTRSIQQPMAFMPLAANEPKIYLLADILDCTIMFTSYTLCYSLWGLIGLGYGICIYNILNVLWYMGVAKIRYSTLPNRRNIWFMLLQTTILFATYMVSTHLGGILYWLAGGITIICSSTISYYLFSTIKKEE
jgi:O-antigen/teichoic acid export membrane protein